MYSELLLPHNYLKWPDLTSTHSLKALYAAADRVYFIASSLLPPSLLFALAILNPTDMSDKVARRAKFETAYQTIRTELLDHFKSLGIPKDAAEWYEKACFFLLVDQLHFTNSVTESRL